MHTLVIAVVTGKGGKYFEAECDAFADHWADKDEKIAVVKLSHAPQKFMKERVIMAIEQAPFMFDRLVFFCHGTPRRLKCGFGLHDCGDLADAIAKKAVRKLDIALYCCSTGRGPFEWPWGLSAKQYMTGMTPKNAGWAFRLMDALAAPHRKVVARVFCHHSRGRTTKNPYCYIFHIGHFWSSIYRNPIVEKGGKKWKQWKQELETFRRFEVPFESIRT